MGKSEWNNRLLPTTLIITATAISFGYDTSWWGGAIAQPYFNVFYGDQLVKTPPVHYVLSAYQTSTAVSVSYLFQVIGLVSCGFVLKYGRKMGLYTICATTVIGTIISLTGAIGKGRYWQIVAGKWIVSIALGMSLGTCPLFLAEVAPPTLRGAMVNTCTTMVTLGGFVAGCVNYAVSLMGFNPAGLQILIAVQLIVPVITACCIWTVPESPRWLVEVGKIDRARETLNFLRRGNPQNEIEAELVSIQATIDIDRRIAASSSWVQLFKGSDLRRTLTVTGVSCLAQASGLAFLGNYAVLYLLDVGITNVFIILMILNGVICAGTFAGFYTQDHFGRRAVLLTTGVISTSALISMGAIATAKPNQPGPSAYAIVFLLFVWAVFYGTGWGNVPITLTSELPSDVLRPKTWAFSGSLTAITGMIISLVNPYLQNPGYGNLQGSVAFIYGAFGVIALIFVYYLVPEVKGKSIYEINWLYVNGVAPRDFRNFKVPPPETIEAKLESGDIDGKEDVAHAEDVDRIA